MVDWGELVVDTDGTFDEGPICIMDSREHVLRQDREASECVVATRRSREGNMRTQRHYTY